MNLEIDPLALSLILAAHPGKEIWFEDRANYCRIYAGDDLIAKEMDWDLAIREAVRPNDL